jgi:large subunit ribosomal protein L23
MESTKVIKNPLSTEKSIRQMESENKLVFVVDRDATKKDVKGAVEEIFKVKVDSVNILVTSASEKRAYVKLNKKFPAIDVATQLGLM